MTQYDELAERAERGELRVKPGTERQGPEAATEAKRLLFEATGTTSDAELTRVALGRPAVGAKKGESPVVRARVPRELKERVAEIAKREQQKESDVVREALAAYVQAQ